MAAEERRRAVLDGLASLGYEASEGMMTAWVAGGRGVPRKLATPGYGVELSGGSQADIMQVRAVGIGNPTDARDVGRDKDMETIWCSVWAVAVVVAKAGGSVSIESARPLGQFPLKVVPDLGVAATDSDSPITHHRARTGRAADFDRIFGHLTSYQATRRAAHPWRPFDRFLRSEANISKVARSELRDYRSPRHS